MQWCKKTNRAGTYGTSMESRAGPISDRVVNPVALHADMF